MLRKSIMLFGFLAVCVSGTNVFAVPTVKQLGANVALNTEKPVAVVAPSTQKTGSLTAKVATTPAAAKGTVQGARIPAITTIKTVNTGNIKQNIQEYSQPVSSGVAKEAFNSLVTRIDALEEQIQNVNTVPTVVEESTGNYVTDVLTDGDALSVSKTSILYVPVRNAGNDSIVSDAEIWIEK